MKTRKDTAASIRQRLYNLSKQQNIDLDAVLLRFAVERVLARISQSSYANRFVLKGAMLFALWADHPHRATRDMDLLGFDVQDAEQIKAIFQDLLTQPQPADDGLIFHTNTIAVAPIRALDEYGGLKVTFRATLAGARIGVLIDIGIGDVVSPAPETVDFPNLLPDFPPPRIRAYPVYTAFAEKFEAIIRLGDANTRMKDFFDLWYMVAKFDLDPAKLRTAIHATFEQRGTVLPPDLSATALRPEFASIKGTTWTQFLNRNRLPEPAGSFDQLLEMLRTKLTGWLSA